MFHAFILNYLCKNKGYASVLVNVILTAMVEKKKIVSCLYLSVFESLDQKAACFRSCHLPATIKMRSFYNEFLDLVGKTLTSM